MDRACALSSSPLSTSSLALFLPNPHLLAHFFASSSPTVMTVSSIYTSSHIVTLPPVHPSAPSSTLLVHLTHLSSSLSIHVTDAPLQALTLAATQEAEDEQQASTQQGEARAAETEEEARQRQVDEAIDGDLAAALAAAGRDTEEPLGQGTSRQAEEMGPPVGCLAKEWAVAMSAGPVSVQRLVELGGQRYQD